ncbi:ras-related protein Rap-1b-like [Tubulanus polymorphus]|uniref:ras-related protein Rap-1b-like n=1 Tax=Tubulanus polymorphus TaxID=672921 RepID=UPI003DA5B17A
MIPDYSVVLLGAGGVGKTSMISQFISGVFPVDYDPTIEDCYRHVVQLGDGFFHTVKILDTAGSHQFPAMRELCIRTGQAFILVFAINNEASFDEALKLGELIIKFKGRDSVPLVLVGNKTDLNCYRQVDFDKASQMASERLNCVYMESCAMYNINIQSLFLELLTEALHIEVKSDICKKSSSWKSRSGSVKCSYSLSNIKRQHSSDNRRLSDTNIYNNSATAKCVIL